MDRIDEVARKLVQGEPIVIGDRAIVIQKVECFTTSDSTTFKIMTGGPRKIKMAFPISRRAIDNSTFDLEGFIRKKLSKGIECFLKRYDRTDKGQEVNDVGTDQD